MFSKGQLQVPGLAIHQIIANPEPVHRRPITEAQTQVPKGGLLHKHRILRAGAVPLIIPPEPQAAAVRLTIVRARRAAVPVPIAGRAVQAEVAAHTAVRVVPAVVLPITAPAARPAGAAHPTAAVHRVAAAVHRVAVQEDHQDQAQEDHQDVKLSFKPGSVRDPGIPTNQNILL